ncbi:MAG TPA: single-stranded-DNA-specific exonuclease RecJ [Prolixibacteraceae bacterium]|nr:single-stranded-DNA-specific exonuclease RecJ [Prolixibacteraceae bacterium]HPS12374.1 single-stranded-DNA-specific exonuclease RecJ [Prolixibacteraceae bacterium]
MFLVEVVFLSLMQRGVVYSIDMTEKVWNYKKSGDINDVKHLSAELNVEMTVANLLVQRDIRTYDEAKAFFRPRLSDLHDPFLMKDMDKAVARLRQAIERQEKVLIYGDYDVDGTTSVALMYLFLKDKIKNIHFYIPDRYSEGYGISPKSVEYAANNNFSLVIVLDCGIKAIEKIAYARTRHVDFIICDHHNPGDRLPDAYAVLDPKRPDCNYPYKELSGCGVGFKFLLAYCTRFNEPVELLHELLDLVVVSIASDIVPLTGENRVLAYFGLIKLNSKPSVGLKTLIEISGISDTEITINDIVFKIGPRLNAAGRIEHGKKSVELLVSTNQEEALQKCNEINSFNEIRKSLDRDITQEALDMITRDEKLVNRKSTVLYNRDWHKGVVGIVASRLIDSFYRPTVILTESNGMATGSARSVKDFDLYEAIDYCSDLLESYGGHMFAAGLTLKLENVKKFSDRFEEFVQKNITQKQQTQTIEVDAKLQLPDITPKFVRLLKQFEPYGPHNMTPVFVTEDVIDSGTSRIVGPNEDHLKLDLVEPNGSSVKFPGIAFSQADKFPLIESGLPFDVCYSIIENEFRGRTSVQLLVRDIRRR